MHSSTQRKHPIINQLGFSHHFLLPLIAILVVGGIGLYMLNMSNAAVNPGDTKGRQAQRAADFIDSQGVVAHLDFPGEPYSDKDLVLKSLNYLGIHNVRSIKDSAGPVRTYVSQNGIKINYSTFPPKEKDMPLSEHLPVADQLMQQRVNSILNEPSTGDKYVKTTTSVEPINEYDNKGDAKWEVAIAAAQKKLWALKPSLTAQNPNVKILGPSITGFRTDDSTKDLQRQNLGAYMDYGNIHTYSGGKIPETTLKPGDGFNGFVLPEAELPKKAGDLASRLQYYSTRVSGTKRMVITETGYHDYTLQPKGEHRYTDPRAVAIYMPRLYLENFRIGVLRTYTYQLFNQKLHPKPFERHFGFFETDGKAKASATAMHDLNGLLKDDAENASTFKPDWLGYTIVNQPKDVKAVVLQKASGKFYLVVWRGESVFTPGDGPNSGRYKEPSAPLSLNLTFSQNRTVNAYNNGSTNRTTLGSAKKDYTISVSARPTILEIQ